MPDNKKRTIQKRLGKRVRELRKEKNLSQEELAFRSGIHRNYIGGIERGERNPCIQNVVSIVEGLGVTLTEFFSDF